MIDVFRWARQRLGLGIVIIEHDTSLVKELADHVLPLHQGRLLASGSIEAVQADPAARAVYAGGTK